MPSPLSQFPTEKYYDVRIVAILLDPPRNRVILTGGGRPEDYSPLSARAGELWRKQLDSLAWGSWDGPWPEI